MTQICSLQCGVITCGHPLQFYNCCLCPVIKLTRLNFSEPEFIDNFTTGDSISVTNGRVLWDQLKAVKKIFFGCPFEDCMPFQVSVQVPILIFSGIASATLDYKKLVIDPFSAPCDQKEKIHVPQGTILPDGSFAGSSGADILFQEIFDCADVNFRFIDCNASEPKEVEVVVCL